MKTLITAVLAVLLLSGCTAYQDALAPAQTEDPGRTIIISDYQFNPQITTVTIGERVTWKNLDKDAHSLRYNDTESEPLERGDTFSIIAAQPGRYEYHSGNHPFIQGILIVSE